MDKTRTLKSSSRPDVLGRARRIGYARVSTAGQTLQGQLDDLTAAGCTLIFSEKQSGAKADRKELARLLASIGPDDEVLVTRIDRLARSLFDLFAIVSQIVAVGASFRSLDPNQTQANTSTANGRLMLAIMGWMADVERDLIRTRTMEGRAYAQGLGKKMGRRPKLTAVQRAEALDRKANGEAHTSIARSFNVSNQTIRRLEP